VVGVVLYNLLVAGHLAHALATGAPAIGVDRSLPAPLPTVAHVLGLSVHTLLLVWAAAWLNESGKAAPDRPYIANLPAAKRQ
jgi:hypothetical protein